MEIILFILIFAFILIIANGANQQANNRTTRLIEAMKNNQVQERIEPEPLPRLHKFDASTMNSVEYAAHMKALREER